MAFAFANATSPRDAGMTHARQFLIARVSALASPRYQADHVVPKDERIGAGALNLPISHGFRQLAGAMAGRAAAAIERAARSTVRALALLLLSTTSHADDNVTSFVLGGVTIAYVDHGADSGAMLGAEASYALTASSGDIVAPQRFIGVYSDVLRDLALDRTRLSIGPELGVVPFGVDAGFMYESGGRRGFCVRPVLTLGVVTVYYRYGQFFDNDAFHEVGIVGKLWKQL